MKAARGGTTADRFALTEVVRYLRSRSPLANRVVLAAVTQRAIGAVRTRKVLARPVRFAAFELLARPGRVARHRLRDSPVQVVVRHRSGDAGVLDELFVRRAYEPPIEAACLLSDGMAVLDLGGNIGLFGALILSRFPNARLTSVEPDPSNLRIIERCVEANDARWQLIRACASADNAPVIFEPAKGAHSRIAAATSADTINVAAIDVFPLIGSANFVKMDIEGGEWPILLDPRFRDLTPSVIALEWHATGCPGEDAFTMATAALCGAGYRTAGEACDTVGTIWAWRT
jgi:FkbM family methyltransferase